MAQQRSSIGGGGYKQETVYKQEPGVPVAANDHHQSHHPHQGPSQHLPHQRPSSVGHPQHQPQHPASQHSNAYQPSHLSQYAPNGSSQVAQHSQEVPYYSHASPYTAPTATGPYTSAATETPDVMAAAGMTRPHYPAIYHTPQSNSPASIASPSGHDQYGRQLYSQAPSHMQQQQSMSYPPPPQSYPPMPQGNPSPYAQQTTHQQHAMGPQSSLLMSHQAGQHQMQHPGQQQMTSSPRGTKQENIPPQLQQRSAPVPQGQAPPQHHNQQIMNTTAPNGTANNIGGAGVSPSTNPGPIPATTPLVVRQDNNGVQWIAFEYSRDRVKMEYTIRCDVESVNVDQLSAEFKNENCVYPRACCEKSAYRGNRFTYETDCNTVGWGLAELNPCLRGKRGLIQRAVDSWRNSNSDPKYRSRRVRRMAKINHRKINNIQSINAMGGQGANMMAGMPLGGPGDMARAVQPGAGIVQQRPLGAPSALHHHHAHPDGTTAGGPDDGSGSDQNTLSPQQQANGQSHQSIQPQSTHAPHNSQASLHSNSQHANAPYQSYPPSASSSSSYAQQFDPRFPAPANKYAEQQNGRPPLNTITNGEGGSDNRTNLDPALFPPVKHPQYLHVHDEFHDKGPGKAKIHVLCGGKKGKMYFEEGVGPHQRGLWYPSGTDANDDAPDSMKLKHSVWPRSWYGNHQENFVTKNMVLENDIALAKTEPEDGREAARRRGQYREGKKMKMFANVDGMDEVEVEIPRLLKVDREREMGVNELGWRIGYLQGDNFTFPEDSVPETRGKAKKVLLQRTLDMYRAKIAKNIEIEGAERGFVIEDYPVFDMRRARREFQEKWGPRNDED